MKVRGATTSDATSIAEVFLAARAGMAYLPRLHSDADVRGHFAALVTTCETWVCIDGTGEVTGFAMASEKCLEHLYVAPPSQGRGMGSALLHRVIHERPAGFVLWTFQQNLNARRFYERAGLREVRRTDGHSNEEQVPDVLYEWRPAIEPHLPGVDQPK